MLTVVLFCLMHFDSLLVYFGVCLVLKFLVVNRSLMSHLGDTFTSSIFLLVCLYAFGVKLLILCIHIHLGV